MNCLVLLLLLLLIVLSNIAICLCIMSYHQRIDFCYREINSFARPVTWASSRAPLASQSDCNVSVNAIPPASVIQSSSSYQIQNLNGFANKAHSNSQLAGSKNTKCSGQDLRFILDSWDQLIFFLKNLFS